VLGPAKQRGANGFFHHPEAPLRDLEHARNYNLWLFERARPHLGPQVLDAGAGLGTFTELAAAEADRVVALEPDPAFVRNLERRFAGRRDVTVLCAELNALTPSLLGTRFDAALCLNVLEHIPDDLDALVRLRDMLRPGGRLLLLVPAHERLYGAYDRAAGHVRRYSRDSLRVALDAAGLEIRELRYVNPLGALAWLVAIRLARRGELPSAGLRLFDRLVPLLRTLDRLRLPFGQSLWAVAQPREVSGA
jgi:SAM-dependent methyltransferase